MAASTSSKFALASPRPKRRRRSTKPRISKLEAARLLALRDRLEQHLEAMVAFLDESDGDADLEPSLGSIENHRSSYRWGIGGTQQGWSMGNRLDLEDEHDGREPPEDDEPTLGWTVDGGGVSSSVSDEMEYSWPETGSGTQLDIHRHAYASEDSEPNLAAPENHPSRYGAGGDQCEWSKGCRDEREEQCEDEGAQCDDEGDRSSDSDIDELCGGFY